MFRRSGDGLAVVAVLLFVFMLDRVLSDRVNPLRAAASLSGQASDGFSLTIEVSEEPASSLNQPSALLSTSSLESKKPDQDAIALPYEDFIITQGLHGAEYGHLAIDLSAGKATVIRSPINGLVTAFFLDPAGSPILILENDRWQVTLVHGRFIVSVGESVRLGQPIGGESNLGNVVDLEGNPCQRRDCGYHTHLNIYDKQIGDNINPLLLFPDLVDG